jgi:hypothetical protein
VGRGAAGRWSAGAVEIDHQLADGRHSRVEIRGLLRVVLGRRRIDAARGEAEAQPVRARAPRTQTGFTDREF